MLCSNAPKTQNPLKFVGVPQTPEPISAVSGPKFTILPGHVEEVLLLNKFFSDCWYTLRRYGPTNLCDGAEMAVFCVLYLQRAVRRAFQTCIFIQKICRQSSTKFQWNLAFCQKLWQKWVGPSELFSLLSLSGLISCHYLIVFIGQWEGHLLCKNMLR